MPIYLHFPDVFCNNTQVRTLNASCVSTLVREYASNLYYIQRPMKLDQHIENEYEHAHNETHIEREEIWKKGEGHVEIIISLSLLSRV